MLVRKICQQEGINVQQIQVLRGGQVNAVFQIDNNYVVRIGAREDAFQRLQRETELLQSLVNEIPVPRIYAFGEQDGFVYQIQHYVPGQNLFAIWQDLTPQVQANLVAELAGYLKILHKRTAPYFGYARTDTPQYATWSDFLAAKFQRTLDEIDSLQIRMVPGFLDLATDYFAKHKHVLQEATPVQIHGDLTLVNVLAEHGKIAALLDFEYALYAPSDYELWTIEAFCLYPNDWAPVDNEIFCATDFTNFIQLLRQHYPDLFATPHLRERVNLYHLEGNLRSYLAWRKANLGTIPADKMAAKEFYMAHITNFSSTKGIRLF